MEHGGPLGGGELGQLLKRSVATSDTAVILHSSLSDSALRPVLARTGAVGAISKTQDGNKFIAEFETIAARVRGRAAP